ncbi:MAG: DUF2029 domain-containing protein [Solirubrobacterales bacterium]|nr:DUF2029 domain-containing protein [Solirubrobacterales bacterium]
MGTPREQETQIPVGAEPAHPVRAARPRAADRRFVPRAAQRDHRGDARTHLGRLGQILVTRWLYTTAVKCLGASLLAALILLGGPALAAEVAVGHHHLLYDFRGGLYDAGVAILHGVSPYRPHFLAHQVAIMRAGGIAQGETDQYPFSIPVYPAMANVAVVPLSLLPFWLSGGVYTLASVAAMLGGIWLLGVRDRRCYALIALSWPFLYGIVLGAVGPFLVLGAGVAWRWRDRLWPPALAIAAIVAAKIFPWTLGAWLLVTRRYRALALCVAACLAITIGAWALIGFHGIVQYPRMMSEMSFLQEGRADSLVAVLLVAGVSSGLASALAILTAATILALAWRLIGRPDGDRRAFGLAVIAALTATPIVWDHYMVLLFAPIALISPRVCKLWLVPVIAPLMGIGSAALVPVSTKLQAYSPDVLRYALSCLVAEAVIAVCLCTTSEQRVAWRAGLRAPLGRSGAPTGKATGAASAS